MGCFFHSYRLVDAFVPSLQKWAIVPPLEHRPYCYEEGDRKWYNLQRDARELLCSEMQPPQEQRTFTRGESSKVQEGWIPCSTHISEKSQPSKAYGALWLSTNLWASPSNYSLGPLAASNADNCGNTSLSSSFQPNPNPIIYSSFCSSTLCWKVVSNPPRWTLMTEWTQIHSTHRTASSTQSRQRPRNQSVPTGRFHPDLPAKLMDVFVFNSAHHTLANSLKTHDIS